MKILILIIIKAWTLIHDFSYIVHLNKNKFEYKVTLGLKFIVTDVKNIL